MRKMAMVMLGMVLAAGGLAWAAEEKAAEPTSVLDFTMKDIGEQPVNLGKYKGKVLLIVNTASKCGLTPQYENLEQLYRKYQGQGLSILAFPANDFGKQEPGTNQEIQEFCTSKFHVSFDLFSKIVVKGDGQDPLYGFLTSPEKNRDFAGPIKWNFTKFLVSREGKVVARFEPKVKPDDPQVIEAIERELKKGRE